MPEPKIKHPPVPTLLLTPELKAAITVVYDLAQQNIDRAEGICSADAMPDCPECSACELVRPLTTYADDDTEPAEEKWYGWRVPTKVDGHIRLLVPRSCADGLPYDYLYADASEAFVALTKNADIRAEAITDDWRLCLITLAPSSLRLGQPVPVTP